MHPLIDGYCVTQMLEDKDVRNIIKNGKEHAMVYLGINSFLLPRNRVIICNDWILFETHSRAEKSLTSLLKKAGFKTDDLSKVENGMNVQIYAIQVPEVLVANLMKFEELLKKREEGRR